ncbi:MAG: DUF4381 domain-containing protein [Endozoicomonas sp.]
MQAQNPLDQLRPNHLPDPIGFWPPAPGWWVSGTLALLALFFLVYFLVKWHRRRRYRRQAGVMAERIMADFEEHEDPARFANDCNRLLKQTALQAFPRQQVARLHGQQWLAFLAEKSGNRDFIEGPGQALGENRFSGSPSVEVEVLYSMTRSWIRKHHA